MLVSIFGVIAFSLLIVSVTSNIYVDNQQMEFHNQVEEDIIHQLADGDASEIVIIDETPSVKKVIYQGAIFFVRHKDGEIQTIAELSDEKGKASEEEDSIHEK